MGTMEDQIRKIVREEIARAFSAAGEVADGALSNDPYQDTDAEDTALCAINKVMERVARDVLANTHPVLSTEHAPDDACTCGHDRYRHREGACFACTCPRFTDPLGHVASTEPVHTITAVPERPRATCTCHRHTHVMGHDDRCGAPFCYCLSPVRARPEHTDVHASTEDLDYNRACTVCEHGEHDQGKCGMHVYRRGAAVQCPCLASRTLGAQRPAGHAWRCTVCEHAPHKSGQCKWDVPGGACTCSGVRS